MPSVPPSVLAVVPARGGSKALPRKNVLPLHGVPLIVYTLRAAAAAELLDRIVVSTDDDEIAEVARAEGVEVVRRPPELAADTSRTEEALIHVLDTLSEPYDYVVTLEPTSPLRSPQLIDACVDLAIRQTATVLTVAEVRDNLGTLRGEVFEPLDPDAPRRRQERAPLHRESSTVYVTRVSDLVESRCVLVPPLYAVVATADEAIDINTGLDFALAEAVLRRREEGNA